MNLLSRDALRTLARKPQGPCVSIYMPTDATSAQSEPHRARLDRLFDQAEARLIVDGVRAPLAKDILAPARNLLNDAAFWEKQGDSLAVFIDRSDVVHCSLPIQISEQVVVSSHFFLTPLFPLLVDDGRFFLLKLGGPEIHLYQGTRYNLREVDLDTLPADVASALRCASSDHPQPAPRALPRKRSWWSQLFGKPPAAEEVVEPEPVDDVALYDKWYPEAEKAVRKLLGEEQVPLILAGSEAAVNAWRRVDTYPHTLADTIVGKRRSLTSDALLARGWFLARSHFRKSWHDFFSLYDQYSGTGRASAEVDEIVRAAHYGRVATLLVAEGSHMWGAFDHVHNKALVHDRAQDGDEDLMDYAVVETFLNGGVVYTVEPEEIPDGLSMAAVFRY